jgi:hypothetical protein
MSQNVNFSNKLHKTQFFIRGEYRSEDGASLLKVNEAMLNPTNNDMFDNIPFKSPDF